MNKDQFLIELKKINIEITQEQMKQLDLYYKLLITENQKYNLTTITEESDVYLKHFYDSLAVVKGIQLNNQYICDIGTGAGFPGMVLKIVFPNLKVDLIDSTTKKCNFLKLVIKKLNLKNINVINVRAEEYSKTNREIYDIAISRAVAPLKHLLEYSVPLLKLNGIFISLKANIDNEINDIEKYYQVFGLIKNRIISFKLPIENSIRTIYFIEKSKKTPNIYPRKYSQIKKSDI